jgi:uncharacterized protein YndB with AHSA1/START domain
MAMKFSTREDIEAPIEHVFARVTDFQNFERQALRRGADAQRIDSSLVPTEGSAWQFAFKFRGKDRKMKATVAKLDAPNSLKFETIASGIHGMSTIELVALSLNRTRISIEIDLTPQGLSARLLLQSLKLAKTNLSRKFKLRVAEFAEDVEEGFARRS